VTAAALHLAALVTKPIDPVELFSAVERLTPERGRRAAE
jgi:hypothetical protein